MRAALSLRMAFEHVRAGFGRMVLSVVVIALGVALVVAVRLMNAAVLASFLDTVDGIAGRAALTVSAGEGLTFPEDVLTTVAAVPGVKLAVPLVRAVAFPDDGSGEFLTVHGVDLTHDAEVRVYHGGDTSDVIDDLVVFLAQPDCIVLGREFALRRGLDVGSRFDLVTPNGVKPFTVRGLLDPEGLAKTLGGRLVVMDLYAAEAAFTAPGQINQIDLLLKEGAATEEVKARVAAVLPAGLEVEESAVRKDLIRKTISGFQAMLMAFALLAVLGGFVICYSRLGAIFEARTWEVGLLRAVGLRRLAVFGELLKESLLLGGIGTLLGISIGIAAGFWALPFVASSTAINFRVPTLAAEPSFTLDVALYGAFVGLLAAVLAAVVPAIRLARKEPISAMTMRGREAPPRLGRLAWVVAPTLLLLAGVLMAIESRTSNVALGNATTAIVALASCALAGPVVFLGSRSLEWSWSWFFGPTGEYAAHHLTEYTRRAALTVGTLGLGLGAILMFSMLGWSFERTLVAKLSSRFRADLIISSAFSAGGYRPAAVNEALVSKISAVSGIMLAVGNQSRDISYRGDTIVLDSYDPPGITDTRVSDWPLDSGALPNALETVARGDGVLASSGFARKYQTRPGDAVRVTAPTGDVFLRVVGVTSGQAENALVLSRDLYRRIWNDDGVFLIHAALASGVDAGSVRAAITQQLGAPYRLQVQSTAELIAYFAQQVREAFSTLYLLELCTLLLIVVAIGDTLATAVLDRTRQLGTMRAVGLDRRRLFAIVVLEGSGIALLGLLLALAMGLALGAFWVRVQFPAILGWELRFHFPWAFATGAVAATGVLCLAGCILPALRAVRIPISLALRNE